VIGEVDTTRGRWSGLRRCVTSVTSRRYLLGTVLAWVLIVYLVGGEAAVVPRAPALLANPSPASSPPAVTTPVTSGRAPATAGPANSPAATAGLTSAEAPTPPSSVPAGAPGGYSYQPAPLSPPPEVPPSTSVPCPLPVPDAPPPDLSAGAILDALGPLDAVAGPYAAYSLPDFGAAGPLVPFVTPLIAISQPALKYLDPPLAEATDYLADVANAAGWNGPESQSFADQAGPGGVKLLEEFSPIEKEFAATPGASCLLLSEDGAADDLATTDSKLATLPALPTLPIPAPPSLPCLLPGQCGPSSTNNSGSSPAVTAAVLGQTPNPVTVVPVSWAQGVSPQLQTAVDALRARNVPVVLDVIDSPPSGARLGTDGFSDFVAETVHSFPTVNAFQIEVPSAAPAGAAQMADLVHGLAAADAARVLGQLIGPGVSVAALGPDAARFWSAFAAAAAGWQPSLVDFVGVALAPTTGESPAGAAGAGATQLLAAERQWSTEGRIPSGVPAFVTVSPGSAASTPGGVARQLTAYRDALGGLDVGIIGFGGP